MFYLHPILLAGIWLTVLLLIFEGPLFIVLVSTIWLGFIDKLFLKLLINCNLGIASTGQQSESSMGNQQNTGRLGEPDDISKQNMRLEEEQRQSEQERILREEIAAREQERLVEQQRLLDEQRQMEEQRLAENQEQERLLHEETLARQQQQLEEEKRLQEIRRYQEQQYILEQERILAEEALAKKQYLEEQQRLVDEQNSKEIPQQDQQGGVQTEQVISQPSTGEQDPQQEPGLQNDEPEMEVAGSQQQDYPQEQYDDMLRQQQEMHKQAQIHGVVENDNINPEQLENSNLPRSNIEEEVHKLLQEAHDEQEGEDKLASATAHKDLLTANSADDSFGVVDVEYFDESRHSESLDNSLSGGGDGSDTNIVSVNAINFPDPIDYSKTDKSKVKKIIRKRSVVDGRMQRENNVIFKADNFGQIKLETYTQYVEKDGKITVSYDEAFESVPEIVTHKKQLEEYAKQLAADRELRKKMGISFKVKSTADLGEAEVLFEESPEEIAAAEAIAAAEEAEQAKQEQEDNLTEEQKIGWCQCINYLSTFRIITCRFKALKHWCGLFLLVKRTLTREHVQETHMIKHIYIFFLL